MTALPTIFHVSNGEFRRYTGSRDMNAFMTFVEEKKWKTIDPIDSWKRPDSYPMSILSWFFRLSHFLKVNFIFLLQDFNILMSNTNLTQHLQTRRNLIIRWPKIMECQLGPVMDSLPLSPSSLAVSLDYFLSAL